MVRVVLGPNSLLPGASQGFPTFPLQAIASQRGYYALIYKYVPDMETKRGSARAGHLAHFQALVR